MGSLCACPRNNNGHIVTSQNICYCDSSDHQKSELVAAAGDSDNNNKGYESVDGYEDMEDVKKMDGGLSKVCSRGHWRPAEDSKLKELVALYGPQNWNLIAEKLEGRSGKYLFNYDQFRLFYLLFFTNKALFFFFFLGVN